MATRTYCDRCGTDIPALADSHLDSEHTVWIGKTCATCCQSCLEILRLVLRSPDGDQPNTVIDPPDERPWWQRLLSA
jgi:hypothetical protein